MGESKIPIFAYVDESGNTGGNIFDEVQPDFFTAALVSRGDFDARWGKRLGQIAEQVGAEALHANKLGLGRLETIASDLYSLLEISGAHFFLSRVEKRYLIATKMFDVLFDSGENAAVAWHVYNVRPLKIMMAFKLASIVDIEVAQEFWDCLLLQDPDASTARIPGICQALKRRLHLLPDQRSREVLGAGLDWVIEHPESVHFVTDQRIARQGHFPNLVAFANLLQGLQEFSIRWKRKITSIIHDEQSEFRHTLQNWHGMFSDAAPDVIKWAGETYSLQMAPGSQFVMKSDEQSAGIQIADLALWLYGQNLKGKALPQGCRRILNLVFERGWHSDFSFTGVEQGMLARWGETFFGHIAPEQIQAAQEMLVMAEERRRASMAQYETDGVPPFMRDTAPPSQLGQANSLLFRR